ncbi:MAG: LysR family transcriptional regulator [Rhodospirillaceae bacterium]
MSLDQSLLESFVAVAETLNFSEAAKRLATVQSAVSLHIQRLEDAVGRRLVDRGRGRGVRLTAEGEAFLVYARRILGLTDEAFAALRDTRSGLPIRFGTTLTFAMSVLPDVLAAFAQDWPEVKIHVSCGRTGEVLRRFETGALDLAFAMDRGRRVGRLFTEQVDLAWVSGPRFRIAPQADVPLVFLSDGRDLRRYAFDGLDRVGRRGVIAHTSPDPVGVRAFLLAGLAVTVMPGIAATPDLCAVDPDLGLPRLGEAVVAAYRPAASRRPEVDAFAEILRARVAQQRK